MPFTVTLDKLRIENIQIFREYDAESEIWQWGLSINYTMLNDAGDSRGGGKRIYLTPEQQAKVVNFVTEFIDDLKAEIDIQTIVD